MKNNIKTLVLNRELILTVALVGAVAMAPLFGQQLVTGTIVNATLFAAVMMVGFRAAAAVAVIPSLIALAAGTLPAAMAAMIPYIMASNIALAGIFAFLRRFGYGRREHCRFGKICDFDGERNRCLVGDNPWQYRRGAGVNDGLAPTDYRNTGRCCCLWYKFKLKIKTEMTI